MLTLYLNIFSTQPYSQNSEEYAVDNDGFPVALHKIFDSDLSEFEKTPYTVIKKQTLESDIWVWIQSCQQFAVGL